MKHSPRCYLVISVCPLLHPHCPCQDQGLHHHFLWSLKYHPSLPIKHLVSWHTPCMFSTVIRIIFLKHKFNIITIGLKTFFSLQESIKVMSQKNIQSLLYFGFSLHSWLIFCPKTSYAQASLKGHCFPKNNTHSIALPLSFFANVVISDSDFYSSSLCLRLQDSFQILPLLWSLFTCFLEDWIALFTILSEWRCISIAFIIDGVNI